MGCALGSVYDLELARLNIVTRALSAEGAKPKPGHSPNKKEHVPARQSHRLTAGGKAVRENRLKNEKAFLCYAEHAEFAQRVESWRSVVHDLSTE